MTSSGIRGQQCANTRHEQSLSLCSEREVSPLIDLLKERARKAISKGCSAKTGSSWRLGTVY